jgi:hypothetical protein
MVDISYNGLTLPLRAQFIMNALGNFVRFLFNNPNDMIRITDHGIVVRHVDLSAIPMYSARPPSVRLVPSLYDVPYWEHLETSCWCLRIGHAESHHFYPYTRKYLPAYVRSVGLG